MVNFVYDHSDYEAFIEAYAKIVGKEAVDHRIDHPPELAEGYVESFSLAAGLSAMITDVSLADDFKFKRIASANELYILHFEKITVPTKLRIRIADQESDYGNSVRYSVYLTSNESQFEYLAEKGLHIQAIFFAIKREWLLNFLNEHQIVELLSHYLNLKTAAVNVEVYDEEYYPHFKTIFDPDLHSKLRKKVIASRMMLLVEIFFKNLLDRIHEIQKLTYEDLTNTELGRIIEIAAVLVNDITREPPTVPALAEMAHMSISKLKAHFKKVFNSGIYEFYQTNRMNFSRLLLSSGKYSVKEVAHLIGYENVSHFSNAFRKQFHYLPSELND